MFLYCEVLDLELPRLNDINRHTGPNGGITCLKNACDEL